MTKQIPESVHNLVRAGISQTDAIALRKIAMTLRRWHELECGTDAGHIERDDGVPPRPWFYSSCAGRDNKVVRYQIADREAGAKRRLNRIMQSYPDKIAYIQTDPRGAALYILDKSDIPQGAGIDSCYNRGVAVYK